MALVLSGSIDISGSMTATTILISSPGAAGMVSSSAQITELAPLMAYTASLKGAIEVSGQNVNVLGMITAQQFNVTYVSSSVLYQSGSTKFGNSNDDTHEFTGSLKTATSTSDYAASFTNINDSSQGILVRTTDNDTSLYLARFQSSGTAVSETFIDRLILNKAGTLNVSGKIGVGASTNPVYKLEVSTTGGSERIRVGTLQNNDNTARFEAITSNGALVANSAWLRVNDADGFTLGTSTYTKANGDSGDFTNLSSEAETSIMTVSGTTSTFNGLVAGTRFNPTYVTSTSGYENITNTISTAGGVYYFVKDSGAGEGSSATTFNITGVPDTDGVGFDLTLVVKKSATVASINTSAIVQINGVTVSEISTVFASGTAAVTTIKTARMVRVGGNWRPMGTVGTY